MRKFLAICTLLTILSAGCIDFGPPVILTFSANPGTITSGNSSTLIWNVTGASTVRIDPNIGRVAVAGTYSISPSNTTTYTITATNSAGSATANTVAIVNPALQPPVITSFSVSPPLINTGNNAVLQWNVTGSASVSITPGIGNMPPSGTQNISPTGTTTYILTASNGSGSVSSTAVLTVNPLPQSPVILEFYLNPSVIAQGQSATLYWKVTGTTNVYIDNGIGNVPPEGSRTVSPGYFTTYTITASNSAGTVTRSTSPGTGPTYLPVVNSFTANPGNILPGQTSTLQWNVSGATSVSIDYGIGTVPAAGSTAVSLTTTITFTLTATNSYGSVSSLVTVTVGAAGNPPVIVSFTASPSSINAGQYSHLSYIIQGDPTSVTIDQGVGPVTQFGVEVGPIETTMTFTLTATNSGGSVTRSVTVTVH